MKRIVFSILYLFMAGLVVATPVSADGEKPVEEVCRTQYGGGVICEKPEKVVVSTGIVENVILAGTLFAAGYILMLAVNKFSQAK